MEISPTLTTVLKGTNTNAGSIQTGSNDQIENNEKQWISKYWYKKDTNQKLLLEYFMQMIQP